MLIEIKIGIDYATSIYWWCMFSVLYPEDLKILAIFSLDLIFL